MWLQYQSLLIQIMKPQNNSETKKAFDPIGFACQCPPVKHTEMDTLDTTSNARTIYCMPHPLLYRTPGTAEESEIKPLVNDPQVKMEEGSKQCPILKFETGIVNISSRDELDFNLLPVEYNTKKEYGAISPEMFMPKYHLSQNLREGMISTRQPMIQSEISEKEEVMVQLELAVNGDLGWLPENQSILCYNKFLQEVIQKQRLSAKGRNWQQRRYQKNVTQHFLTLMEFAIRFLESRTGLMPCVREIKTLLNSSVSGIAKMTSMITEFSVCHALQPLKYSLLTEKMLAKMVMALPAENADKLTMLRLIPNFILAVHNSTIKIIWQDILKTYVDERCVCLAQGIKQSKTSLIQIIDCLREVRFQTVSSQDDCPSKWGAKPDHLYHVVIKQAIAQLTEEGLLDEKQVEFLGGVYKNKQKSISVRILKDMMKIKTLRRYLLSGYINNNRILIEVLLDGCMAIDKKLSVIEHYSKFVELVEMPKEFVSWSRD